MHTTPQRARSLRAACELELDPAQDPFSADAIRHLVQRYGSPLFLIDAVRLRTQYHRLAAALPGVALHYAVKSLPHPAVLAILRDAGADFDLATTGEVELVRALGIAPERCIHTHPIKRDADIRNALAYGVNRFVVDNPEELRKFTRLRARVSLLIRVAFRGREALCDLSRKFGCEPEAVAGLLEEAAARRIEVEGLSFHAGSQASTPTRHVEAIETCAALLRDAAGRGHRLRTLDIGGGFPIDYGAGAPSIEAFCAPIRAALAALSPDLKILAEPGRYLSAPAAVAVASVMGRAERDGRWWYYLDDGLYGSYSGQMFDRVRYPLEALVPKGPGRASVLAGPTCDSVDVIADEIELPELKIGDLIVGRTMGAYTWASASEFNLFPRATVVALDAGRRVVVESRA
jgi:ornithine decarboxylase